MKLFGTPTEKNGAPRIERISPPAAIPGGEIAIYGSGFASRTGARPVVHFGEAEASLMLATDNRVIARVPDSASGGELRIANANNQSQPHPVSQRAARAARSGFAIQDHVELQRQTVRHLIDQSFGVGTGP